MAIMIDVTIEAFSTKEISFVLGSAETKEEALDTAYKYSNIGNCKMNM